MDAPSFPTKKQTVTSKYGDILVAENSMLREKKRRRIKTTVATQGLSPNLEN